jgi:kynurenine formamidase
LSIYATIPAWIEAPIEYLNDLGAISVGADAPSIDSYNEVAVVREQPAHIVCREREILNIENSGTGRYDTGT